MKHLPFLLLGLFITTNTLPKDPIATHMVNDQARILVTSIPKSGTHMVEKLVSELTELKAHWKFTAVYRSDIDYFLKNNYYGIGHITCSSHNYEVIKKNNYKVILMLRDPRDVLVSYAYFIKKNPEGNFLHGHTCPLCKASFKKLTVSEIISFLIHHMSAEGPQMPGGLNIVQFYNLFLPWQNYDSCYITTFEKLIGSEGGGDSGIQNKEIEQIANFLGTPIVTDKIKKIQATLFGPSRTFRSGQIGGWRQELTKNQKEELKKLAGFNDLLIKLNYESDKNW